MALLADRFFRDAARGDVIDLATGADVRVVLEERVTPAYARERTEVCDRLEALRHPLLVPLVDYGMCGADWFEAHARVPPLPAWAGDARRTAVHLVRFLRSVGVDLNADAALRHIRPARTAARGAPFRPLGIVLQWRPILDAVAAVLEAAAPPGVTRIAVAGPVGSGLRTLRLRIARMARTAGYVVVDAQFAALEGFAGRHVCVLDWMASTTRLPDLFGAGSTAGARRHVWICFCRAIAPGARVLRLEPLMPREMTSAIYLDAEFGPTPAELRHAVMTSRGLPGALIGALASNRSGGVGWLHETAPEYVVRPHATPTLPPESACPRTAGLARLQRAVGAAQALVARGRHARAARVLDRCAPALAARGDLAAAALAACDLGDLWLDRGRPAHAASAFERARSWARSGALSVRALIGAGRVLLEQARLAEAEAAFRTACLAAEGTSLEGDAHVWLARTLWQRGQYDAARSAVGERCPAVLSAIQRSSGDLIAAAQTAAAAVRDTDVRDYAAVCEAQLAVAQVRTTLGDTDAVAEHGAAAIAASRRARRPMLRLVAAAEVFACLERCGRRVPRIARQRLLRAAAKLPPLAAARIRHALQSPLPQDAAAVPSERAHVDLIHRFQALLDAIHDTPDDAASLQVIATDLLRTASACSVAIRSARMGRTVAVAGRAWPGETALSQRVLNGSSGVFIDGVMPEASEPIRAAGAVIGAVSGRWVTGSNPSLPRIRELMKVAAVAAAPLVRAVSLPPPRAHDDALFPDERLGRGEASDRVRESIRKAALAPYPVLVEGESGSGKELVARSIHARSARRVRRFCALNCAALTEDLLEAELFGHSRGAFTGAAAERAGLFEEADQGTLFLDEVRELSARAQAKLLRVLQEGEVRRIGENVPRKVDVRIVAATNRSLEEEVRADRFRADLRFRLDVIRIVMPPLRERLDELPWLVERLWTEAAARVGTRATLGDDMLGALARYDWPGNVRELQNVIAALAVHGPRRGRVPVSLLPARIAQEAARACVGFDEARLEFERRFVRAALARSGGRRTLAAAQLKVSRQGLVKILKRLGLE